MRRRSLIKTFVISSALATGVICYAPAAKAEDALGDVTEAVESVENSEIEAEEGVTDENIDENLDSEGEEVTDQESIGVPVYGWYEADGKRYFYQNGEKTKNEVLYLEGYHYYFGDDGVMRTGRVFIQNALYVGKDGTLSDANGYYRFAEDGRMITGWYKYESMKEFITEYYLPDGHQAEGFVEIEENTYYFNSGRLYRGELVEDGILYVFGGADGALVSKTTLNPGWNKRSNYWYYVQDGKFLKDDWLDYKGSKYYFDYDGRMAIGLCEIHGNRYRFDADGRLVIGWYSVDDYYWSYSMPDGTLIHNGVQTINGKTYIFTNGSMQREAFGIKEGVLYASDINGYAKAIGSSENGWKNGTYYVENGKPVIGWKKIDGYWYYFNENGAVTVGFYTINGQQYYFDSIGRMKTGWFTISTEWYWADSAGVLARNCWKKIGGYWYYFGYDLCTDGIYKIEGKNELFDADGRWVRTVTEKGQWITYGSDKYYVDEMGNVAYAYVTVDGVKHYFTNKGKLEDASNIGNRWYWYLGKWTYIDENGDFVMNTWKKIDGKWYYFNYETMVTGDYTIDGLIYHFNDNGTWDGKAGIKPSSRKDGWYLSNGQYSYWENGKAVVGWKKINNKWYYFDNGYMLFYTIFKDSDGYYYGFDSEGRMVKNAWVKFAANEVEPEVYSYADSNGHLVDGLQTINGKKYFFSNCWCITNDCMDPSYKYYYEIAKSGEITKIYTASGTGWVKTSKGEYLYSKDGKFVNGPMVINSKFYYFAGGVYDSTQTISSKIKEGWNKLGTGYVENEYGSYIPSGDSWGYVVDGKYVSGCWKVGNSYYYFEQKYYTIPECITGLRYVDGVYYYFDSNKGTRTKITMKQGWNQVAGEWYYFNNGKLIRYDDYTMLFKIDGAYYRFRNGGAGSLYQNRFVSNSGRLTYSDANGVIAMNKWVKDSNGVWYYFGHDGLSVTGTHVINGKTYIFSGVGRLISQ